MEIVALKSYSHIEPILMEQTDSPLSIQLSHVLYDKFHQPLQEFVEHFAC